MKSMIKTLALVSVLLAGTSTASSKPTLTAMPWTRQFGTAGEDCAKSVSFGGLKTYVAGDFSPSECGDTSIGNIEQQVFLRRYDSSGKLLWTREFGSTKSDRASGVAADSDGNAYVAGVTYGVIGQSSAGGRDAFVTKFDAVGNALWTSQFGSSEDEEVGGIAVDGNGNVYVSGSTEGALSRSHGLSDAFVRKYDAQGNAIWTRQFGSSADDGAVGIAADATGAYVPGYINKYLFESDVLVIKLDTAGFMVWKTEFGGTGEDEATEVALDGAGNAYVSGWIGGYAKNGDSFLRKYDAAGDLAWSRVFGTSGWDEATSVATDSAGNALIIGKTNGNLAPVSKGGDDAYIRKYDAAGNVLWTNQFGTGGYDNAWDVAADNGDNPLVAGIVTGAFVGQSWAGETDGYLTKFVVPSFVLQPLNQLLQPAAMALLGPQ
jgi:beta-propeller repeat-containing protein